MRLRNIVFDCHDAYALATFWSGVVGRPLGDGDVPGEECIVEMAEGPTLFFAQVPEPKTVKNRLHWDVRGEVDELLAAGARLLREPDGDIRWHILADPEGNEFCVFPPQPADGDDPGLA